MVGSCGSERRVCHSCCARSNPAMEEPSRHREREFNPVSAADERLRPSGSKAATAAAAVAASTQASLVPPGFGVPGSSPRARYAVIMWSGLRFVCQVELGRVLWAPIFLHGILVAALTLCSAGGRNTISHHPALRSTASLFQKPRPWRGRWGQDRGAACRQGRSRQPRRWPQGQVDSTW